MAIYLYKQKKNAEKAPFELVDTIPLAGYNAIYNQWKNKGEPRNKGWQVGTQDLENEMLKLMDPIYRPVVLIDYDPSGKEEIVLLQVKDIYAYTYACKETGKVWWTPLMLILQKVFGRDLPEKIDVEQRERLITSFYPEYQEEIFEFLYLQGEDRGWSWGMVGRVNAAIIPPEAREYFRPRFCSSP